MTNQRQVYADRQRCEAAGLEYSQREIETTIGALTIAATKKNVPVLDKLKDRFDLQCAAFLESQYERAGVISGGGES